MSGFKRIKRKLEKFNKNTNEFEIIFQDEEAIEVEYEKFYYDDEILNYNQSQFNFLISKLQINSAGRYKFSVDTLGAYINTSVNYEASYTFNIRRLNFNFEEE